MDAFFAAIEQRDRPELRGKPVLVGGSPHGRGVVSTASYEARPFGCHSALPMAVAIRRCPSAIVVRPRMEHYVAVSRQIFSVLKRFTPLIEPLSIDEAFLDVTGSTRLFGAPERIAGEIKRGIREKTDLTGSVGIAPNKFLAKIASDLQKPDGLVNVPRDGVQDFLDPLPISRLWGAGKVTQKRFDDLGVRTFADLRRLSETELRGRFGDAGGHFHRLVRGIDDREVVPDREAKSISHEVTFSRDVADHEHLRSVLLQQMDDVARRLRQSKLTARTITLKIRSGDFTTITRSATIREPTDRTDVLWSAAAEVFEKWSRTKTPPVRLIGVGVSQLAADAERQLSLFDAAQRACSRRLDRTVDQIREKYGRGSLTRGVPPDSAGRQGRT